MKRWPSLAAVAPLIVAAVVAAVWFAVAGPPDRSGAVSSSLAALASALAALTAIYLSKQALARTDQQIASAHTATILSRYPLLLPVHQSITFPGSSGRISSHPPSEERFELRSASAGCYAFIEDTVKDTFIIPLENAGEGPALGIAGQLWRTDGAMGEVAGPATLAVGRVAIMTAQLQGASPRLPLEFEEELRRRASGIYFWLSLSYFDLFNNPRSSRAVFDPHGTGAWHYRYEPTVKAGDRAAESPATAGTRGETSGVVRIPPLTRPRRLATVKKTGEKVDVPEVNKG